jgi:hypothetical protein
MLGKRYEKIQNVFLKANYIHTALLNAKSSFPYRIICHLWMRGIFISCIMHSSKTHTKLLRCIVCFLSKLLKQLRNFTGFQHVMMRNLKIAYSIGLYRNRQMEPIFDAVLRQRFILGSKHLPFRRRQQPINGDR